MSEANNIKNENVNFRCTSDEKIELQKQALEKGESLGEFIIGKCLKEKNRTDIIGLCEMQTLLNKLKGKIIRKKEFIENMERILRDMKWQ